MNRIFFIISLACFLFACQQPVPLYEPTSIYYQQELKPFYHGVASGDPLTDRVIIWTRVTPETALASVEVDWEVALDADFSQIAQQGTFNTTPDRDYTVKVDVKNLKPGQVYHYRFKALDGLSPVGRTKTAPEVSDSLQFAVVSCANYEWGYFNAYGRIADRESLDAVIHLGDYIYEYEPGTYGDTTIGRTHLPAKEIITLADYRIRYAQYRLDPDLRAAHQAHPFIAIWDDHEIANNTYKDGAQNHQEEEGSFEVRKNAAVQVYYEWMPVREDNGLYRTISYGQLADLIMLDERVEGRTEPADSLEDPSLQDENRTMLGSEQYEWLVQELTTSQAKWKVVGNQVIYSYLNWGHANWNINLDSWDGYPAEQARIARVIQDNQVINIVFITGDTHSSWAFEATNRPFDKYDPETGSGAFAVEFGTTSINSSNANERFPDDTVRLHEQQIVNSSINPHLKYANLRDHGYLLLTLTDTAARADWYYVTTLSECSEEEVKGKTLWVKAGSTRLRDHIRGENK